MDAVLLALPQEPAGGVAGWAAGLVDTLGGPGAGLAIALENLFPPLPSEVILPLTGFAAGQGVISLASALFWTTLGSVAGAAALYWIGMLFGRARMHALWARLPWSGPPIWSAPRRGSRGTAPRPCCSDAWCRSSGA